MKKRYTAALQGQSGHLMALRRTWASRFHSLRAIVLVCSRSERLELEIKHSAQADDDMVTLTRRNWHTGEETILYAGTLTGGTPKKKRQSRD